MLCFVCYSHKDEDYRAELETSLALLKRQETISVWHDRKILPGDDWERRIDQNLESADVILLLISPDFLDSDYCYDTEMTRALERHHADEARVIPIILRPCDWHSAPFGKLHALPRDAKPISQWDDRDEAWLDVAQGLRRTAAVLP